MVGATIHMMGVVAHMDVALPIRSTYGHHGAWASLQMTSRVFTSMVVVVSFALILFAISKTTIVIGSCRIGLNHWALRPPQQQRLTSSQWTLVQCDVSSVQQRTLDTESCGP